MNECPFTLTSRILCWIKFSTAKLNVHKSWKVVAAGAAEIVAVVCAVVAEVLVEVEVEQDDEDIGLTLSNYFFNSKINFENYYLYNLTYAIPYIPPRIIVVNTNII